jgi:hypothetical protein
MFTSLSLFSCVATQRTTVSTDHFQATSVGDLRYIREEKLVCLLAPVQGKTLLLAVFGRASLRHMLGWQATIRGKGGYCNRCVLLHFSAVLRKGAQVAIHVKGCRNGCHCWRWISLFVPLCRKPFRPCDQHRRIMTTTILCQAVILLVNTQIHQFLKIVLEQFPSDGVFAGENGLEGFWQTEIGLRPLDVTSKLRHHV